MTMTLTISIRRMIAKASESSFRRKHGKLHFPFIPLLRVLHSPPSPLFPLFHFLYFLHVPFICSSLPGRISSVMESVCCVFVFSLSFGGGGMQIEYLGISEAPLTCCQYLAALGKPNANGLMVGGCSNLIRFQTLDHGIRAGGGRPREL